MPAVLERELQYFAAHKAELLSDSNGQFVLIKDDELLGTYATFEDAYEEGVKLFGGESFLIKQVQDEDEVVYVPNLTTNSLTHLD